MWGEAPARLCDRAPRIRFVRTSTKVSTFKFPDAFQSRDNRYSVCEEKGGNGVEAPLSWLASQS
eukprot:1068502-Prymnesium_polylepis.2